MTVNKFREESEVVILECPVVLGSLYGLLDPYEIVWQDEGKGIDFLDNSYNRSPDNQFLMIPSSISTPREYKCFLRLRRCNNNRCTSIHESAANTLLLNLIGKDTTKLFSMLKCDVNRQLMKINPLMYILVLFNMASVYVLTHMNMCLANLDHMTDYKLLRYF